MSNSTRAIRWWVAVAAVLAAGAGCARPKPVVTAPPAALEVPVVPPRVVGALPEEQPPEEAAPAEPEKPRPSRPSRPRPKPAPPADAAPAKPDAAQEPAPEPPKPAEQPGTVLRTPQTVDESEAARRVRSVLGRATDQLSRVNVGALGPDARAQYETARRFIDQAEGALKARNFVFASYLADKAETLARGLGGR